MKGRAAEGPPAPVAYGWPTWRRRLEPPGLPRCERAAGARNETTAVDSSAAVGLSCGRVSGSVARVGRRNGLRLTAGVIVDGPVEAAQQRSSAGIDKDEHDPDVLGRDTKANTVDAAPCGWRAARGSVQRSSDVAAYSGAAQCRLSSAYRTLAARKGPNKAVVGVAPRALRLHLGAMTDRMAV